MRRVLATLAVALMVLTAGCGGLLNDGTTTPDDSPQTTTPTPTPDPVGPESVNESLKQTHEDALRDAGSFASEQTVRLKTNATASMVREIGVTNTYKVNFTSDSALAETGGLIGQQVTYTRGETTYRQSKMDSSTSDENATYQKSNGTDEGSLFVLEPVNRTEAIGTEFFFINENVTYERVGSETYAGTPVARFEVDGAATVETWEQLLGNETVGMGGQNVSIENVSSVLLVGDSGVIHHHAWSVTVVQDGEATTISYEYNLSGVGDTTVSAPEWLEYANESAAQDTIYESGSNDCAFNEVEVTYDQQFDESDGYTVTLSVENMGEADSLRVDVLDGNSTSLTFNATGTKTVSGLSSGDYIAVYGENATCEAGLVDAHYVG